jgi:predicted amidohydrolase YtcJ
MSVRGAVLLTDARVYRHDGDTDLPPVQDVLIADGVIKAIGAESAREAPREKFDLSGQIFSRRPMFLTRHRLAQVAMITQF